jgi:hypothetical protein
MLEVRIVIDLQKYELFMRQTNKCRILTFHSRAYALIMDGISEKHPTHPAHVAPNLRSGVGDMGGVFFFLPFHRACAREISDKPPRENFTA